MKSNLFLTSTLFILALGAFNLSSVAFANEDDDVTGYAFISYVSDIPQNELPDVKNDADFLNDVLSLNYYRFNVSRFRNSHSDVSNGSVSAALDSFVKKFKAAADKAEENKPFVAYLGGHMFVKDDRLYYPLVDYDGKDGNEEVAACSAEQICEIMRDCKASVKILFVDCCFSGSGSWDVDVFGNKSDFVTFASSQSWETSKVWREKHASLFTYWLAFGLRGYADKNYDGKVSLKELKDYVTSQVGKTAKALGVVQNPKMFNVESYADFEFHPAPMRLDERLDEIAELIVTDLAIEEINNEQTKKIELCVPEFSTGKRSLDVKTTSPKAGSVPRTRAVELGKKMKNLTSNWSDYPINGVFRRLGLFGRDFGWITPEAVEDALRESGAPIGASLDDFIKMTRATRSAIKEKVFTAEYAEERSYAPDKKDFKPLWKNKKLALVQVNLEDYEAAGVKVSAEIIFDCEEDFGRAYFCHAIYSTADLANLGYNADNSKRPTGAIIPIADSPEAPNDQLDKMNSGPGVPIPSLDPVKKKTDVYPREVVKNLVAARAEDATTQSENEQEKNENEPKTEPAKLHPLEKEKRSYDVYFMSRPISSEWKGNEGYKRVKTTFKDGEAFVEFAPDEEYAIVVENKGTSKNKKNDASSLDGSLYARITVDGRDTISWKSLRDSNDASLESWRQDWLRVSVDKANGWLVKPGSKSAVFGFSKPNLKDSNASHLRRFQVVGADKLGEERDAYAEMIGLITFQLHRAGDVERGSEQDAATVPRPTEIGKIDTIKGAIGDVVATFSIHYRLKDVDNSDD